MKIFNIILIILLAVGIFFNISSFRQAALLNEKTRDANQDLAMMQEKRLLLEEEIEKLNEEIETLQKTNSDYSREYELWKRKITEIQMYLD